MHKKFGEDRTYSSKDMIADRQTHTHTHTHTQTDRQTLITIPGFPIGGGVTTCPLEAISISESAWLQLSKQTSATKGNEKPRARHFEREKVVFHFICLALTKI